MFWFMPSEAPKPRKREENPECLPICSILLVLQPIVGLSRLDEGNDRKTLQSSNLGHKMPKPSVTLFDICYFMAPASSISLKVLEAATYLDNSKDRFSLSCNVAVLKKRCAWKSFLKIFLHVVDTFKNCFLKLICMFFSLYILKIRFLLLFIL